MFFPDGLLLEVVPEGRAESLLKVEVLLAVMDEAGSGTLEEILLCRDSDPLLGAVLIPETDPLRYL